MALNRPAELHPKQADHSRRFSKGQSGFSPWLFQHQDLIRAMESAETVSQETLVNAINRIHFEEGSVFVHVRHPKYEESILFPAHPDPCTGRELTCHWSDKNPLDLNLVKYQLLHLIIEDGKSIILVPGKLQSINQGFFSIQLPETSYSMGQRQARRFVCKEVVAELSQSGFHAIGELLDFSPVGLRMRVRPERPSSFHWFNTDELVSIQLRHDKQVFFSGACECIREQHNFRDMEIVLAPRDEGINRFKKKPIRNPRVQLLPSPSITFDHPLLRKRFQLEVCDMSTSGFSVYEEAGEGVL
ncbi:MAG: hypothetical protein ACFFCW_44935, partial [Candidatus Hodarchaeota archaeon]